MGLPKNQLQRINEDVLFEQDRRVEFSLWDENERIARDPWAVIPRDLADLLKYRSRLGRKYAERWAYKQQREEPIAYADEMPHHGVLCDCDTCDEAVKKLLRACGVLPKGRRR